MHAFDSTIFAENYLRCLLDSDRLACSSIAKMYLAQNPSIKDLYEEVFKVALYEVGRLWENNKITVAAEHMATAITEGILNELYETFIPQKSCNKKVVVACVENEQHQVGIKMVADVFEMKGWESFFPGAGMATAELIKFIEGVKPDILAISLSVYFNFSNLIKMLRMIKHEFPDLQIIIGGQALGAISDDALKELGNVMVLRNLYLLEKHIDSINENSSIV